MESIIDSEDYDKIKGYTWYAANVNKGFRPRAQKITNGKCKFFYIHRLVMDCPDNMIVDHINGDPMDNRKINLRICTYAENCKNRKKTKSKTASSYRGVTWHKRDRLWHARITVNGSVIFIGCFDSEMNAAMARDKAELKYFGEFAKPNFIIGAL